MVNCQEWDGFHYRRALYPLIRYSLLQLAEGEWPRVTMHGLVQWRAKKHLPDRPWDLWVSISVSAVCHQAEPTFLIETNHFLQISLTLCVVR